MRSRVMPGSLVTMERRVPVRRLNSVDLPTLGRPTMTRDGRRAFMNFGCAAILQCSASSHGVEGKLECFFLSSVWAENDVLFLGELALRNHDQSATACAAFPSLRNFRQRDSFGVDA